MERGLGCTRSSFQYAGPGLAGSTMKALPGAIRREYPYSHPPNKAYNFCLALRWGETGSVCTVSRNILT
jgi:hypothetical protein